MDSSFHLCRLPLSHSMFLQAQSQKTTKTHYMCYKILINTSSIPSSYFTPHPSPSPRLHHNKALFIPLVKTTSFKCSFSFVDVIPVWNSLPSNFVSSSSISSFKRLIRSHLFLVVYLLCTFILVSLSLCVCVWGDTYISSSAILSTHMQLALKFSYK